LDDFVNWLRNPSPDTSGRREFALFLFVVAIALIFVTVWSAVPRLGVESAPDLSLADPPPDGQSTPDLSLAVPPPVGQSTPDLNAHQKRLASKAAYRGAPLR
jgi:hypothetical protein